jgi:hypothetical protein
VDIGGNCQAGPVVLAIHSLERHGGIDQGVVLARVIFEDLMFLADTQPDGES